MVILLSSIALHAYFKFNIKTQVHRLFLKLILLTILLLMLEILSVVLNSGYFIYAIVAHKLVDTLGFTLSPLVPMSAARYIYIKTNKGKKINKSTWFWLSIPFVVYSIISLGSYNYEWIFHITKENTYVRGPLFFVAPMINCLYYMINVMLLYDNRKKINREELFILSLLTIIPTMMSVFQLCYFIYLTIWNSVAIAVIINYIYIVHSQIKLDPLTGLGNRVAYNEYLASLCRRSNIVFAVISIDLDDFKSINDICGHHEGDQVLILFARQLEEVFRDKGVTIRMGGDEFIILLHENQREVLEKYISTLIDNLDDYNERSDVSYRIKFSYGLSIFDNEYQSIYELIQHSDKLMYEDKQKTGKTER